MTSSPSLKVSVPVGARLHFGAGIPGFPHARVFSLRPWGTGPTPFYVMESTDLAGLCFVVVSPSVFFPWYEPHFGPEVYQAVEVPGPDGVEVLVILTLHSRPQDTTANLLGPVVVNSGTGEAVQAVLSGSGFDPQTPIVTSAKSA
ncbi:MAG TPA: flagellar assembly protein FliW [Acidimicrobiales bacterium]|nr:flagellar assembly protein FliW [Acidimicrobiales bacterium]